MITQILRINDTVVLRKGSKIQGHTLENDKYNPFELEGTIIKKFNEKQPSLPIIVKWSNGFTNSYDDLNLKKIN